MSNTEAKSSSKKVSGDKKEKNKYSPRTIEPKWQAIWKKEKTYQPDLSSAKTPFYNLMMFPYPSAEGLHIGGVRTFAGVDIYGRYKRMQGNDVFEPFGLDGFGIHAENYALKIGEHPMELAKVTEKNFYRQIEEAGIGVDWSRKVETYDPDYYKWTQWLFTELFKAGLAYRKNSSVNFCPHCKTVLADEQVIDGKCERCGTVVEKRELEQWFFRITKYAERLLNNIEKLNWSEKVKIAQRNWIGRKEGINISYEVEGLKESIEVFTTRPETNFGATFIALAPEHDFVNKIIAGKIQSPNTKAIKEYVEKAKIKSKLERETEGKEKTGRFSGFYAINQLTNYKMPIWISDFVLTDFGTGALVGVPAHDKRDFEFAAKFDLEVKRVVVGNDGVRSAITNIEQVQEEEGTIINSDFLNGMEIHKATEKIMDYIEEKAYGKREISYHLRDWLISRQRYWGPPIPMIYCETCARGGKGWLSENSPSLFRENNDWNSAGWYPVPQEDLPVKLPFVKDYKPMGTGKAPLANYPDFYSVKCPNCGSEAMRETDISDNFLDSSWYFLRYPATGLKDAPFANEIIKKWLPVNMYIGGAEHSVLHLLYSRFTTMVLYDLGLINFEEPFVRFYAHGLIIKDGAKMSKSKGNVVTPDIYVKKHGADTLRMYLHFLAPFNQEGDFYDTGVEAMNRFLKRVWALLTSKKLDSNELDSTANAMLHKTIKGVTEDLEALRYNTAIAKLMIYYNFLVKKDSLSKHEVEVYIQLLAPFTPYITEELWEFIGNPYSVHTSKWPKADEKYLVQNTVTIPVQVNGKLRATLTVSVDASKDRKKIEELAKNDEKVGSFLKGTIRNIIYVPGKVLNFVVI